MSEDNFRLPEFIQKLKDKDPEATTLLIKEYTLPLMRCCYGLGMDTDMASECVQKTWVIFFTAIENFKQNSHIKTFVFGILYNVSHEHFRYVKKASEHDPIDELVDERFAKVGWWIRPPIDPEKMMDDTQTSEMIKECLKHLPAQQKSAFILKEVEDEISEEICKILDVTTTNLGVLLYRARNRLRECLEKKISDGGGK